MASSAPAAPVERTIALIAHDAKKDVFVEFCSKHVELLRSPGVSLVATGTTGGRVADATGLAVQRFLSGPLGGDQQIGALVATGNIAAVVFIVDPLSAHPHEPDVVGLQRICNVHNVPLATNLASAHLLLTALLA